MIKSFLIALSFFTRIPIKIKSPVSETEFFKSMLFMPVIGLILGILLYGIAFFINPIPSINIKSILLVIIFIILTGGLHLDGLADSADAFFSSKDKKKMLKIMKDSRLGTFGAVTLILVLMSYFSGYSYLFEIDQFESLILMPVVGRYCGLQLGAFSKPVSTESSLGKSFCEVDKPIYPIIYFVIIILSLSLLTRYILLLSFIITAIVVFLFIPWFKHMIGGITGDQLGFTIELSQVLFLFISIFLMNFRI